MSPEDMDPPERDEAMAKPTEGPCIHCKKPGRIKIADYGGKFHWQCDAHPLPRQVPPHTPGWRGR